MADISYTPTTWADGSGGGTPIDATKLNNIETGISDAVAAIGPNDTTADGTLKAQIDALREFVSNFHIALESNGEFAVGLKGDCTINGTACDTVALSIVPTPKRLTFDARNKSTQQWFNVWFANL